MGHPSSRKRYSQAGAAFGLVKQLEEGMRVELHGLVGNAYAVCHDDGADHAGAHVALLAGGDEAGHGCGNERMENGRLVKES